MRKWNERFTSSYRELKHARTVTVCALMGAAAIVLGSLSIYVTDTIRIGFSGITNKIVHYLFGPVTGSLFAGTMDVLKYLVKPSGPFFPGFTLVTMAAGLIYGCFFYKRTLSFGRVLAAHLTVSLVCNVFLNTACLSFLYGKGMAVLLPPRLVKNLIMWPIDSIIFYHVAKALDMAGVFRALRGNRASA